MDAPTNTGAQKNTGVNKNTFAQLMIEEDRRQDTTKLFFYQMAALFSGRDSSGLGLRRAPSLNKLSRNFKGSSMD